ncbi:armadillo-type protein [Dunaliella salina]|uniref:Armadillo-type protein n=1 Tax=Dunaliella salina TaxID=3046 RepID=A0ABQ7FU88_DUNSA|nr:armadillo-type protein [Dunaliella salina]|eukprot:KAF5825974.1 armadillo-type protein [Dunaliella salina]
MTGDVPLIPPLRSEAEGWGHNLFPPLRSEVGSNGTRSALIGEWQPTPSPGQGPASAQAPGAAGAPGAAPEAVQGGGLSDEELQRKTDSLLEEYASTLDKKEALQCVRELQSPAFMPKLVERTLDRILNSVKDIEQTALSELLLHLHGQGVISSKDLISGLTSFTSELEDLRMDFPKAPQQLSQFLGMCINGGALGLEVVPQVLEGDIGAEAKRDFAGSALRTVRKALGSDDKMAAACSSAGLHAKSFLEATPEDGDLPSVQDWLQGQGLSSVPL